MANTMSYLNEAKRSGVDFALLPELFHFRGTGAELIAHAQSLDGPVVRQLSDLAATHSMNILLGSILEAADADRCYNSSVLIDRNGKIAAVYRKIHLFDAHVDGKHIDESQRFLSGSEPVLAKVDEIPIGLSICYDLRFPELYRGYSQNGAKLLSIPASFTHPTGDAHWEVLCRARAIENQAFVLAPNQTGIGAESVPSYGHSMIIDPWGNILARASADHPELLIADIDFDKQDAVRTQLPCLRHRRINS